jgi:YVTN family beta-propeller protein
MNLERAIPLKGVSGRIDHLALDVAGRRLFVAELGNGSVEAIDLASGRSVGRITGLTEPQGLAYLPSRNELVIATGGDGAVGFYRASDMALVGTVAVGADADDVRVDAKSGAVVVGWGSGALAVIDPATRTVVRNIPLTAHPEGFQLRGQRAFVNLPEAGGIGAIDTAAGRQIAKWPNGHLAFNFPLALDGGGETLAVVYRLPARLVLMAADTGQVRQTLDTCGDADDLFFDDARRRIYVVCGSGAVDVFEGLSSGYVHAARVSTRGGARTGLFSPELDRLFVAARATGTEGAAVLVYRLPPRP